MSEKMHILALSGSDVERVIDSLNFHFDLTENTEEDELNKAVVSRIEDQVKQQGDKGSLDLRQLSQEESTLLLSLLLTAQHEAESGGEGPGIANDPGKIRILHEKIAGAMKKQ